MNDEVTMSELKPLLAGISAQLTATNNNVIAMRNDLEEARRDISATIKDNAVMEEKIKTLKENNDEKHVEINTSLNKNWDKTREIESKIIRWGGLAAGFSLASGAFFKYFV